MLLHRRTIVARKEVLDRLGERARIVGRNEQAVAAGLDDLRQSANRRRDHGPREVKRRKRDTALRFDAIRRENDIARSKPCRDLRVGDEAKVESNAPHVIPSEARDLGGGRHGNAPHPTRSLALTRDDSEAQLVREFPIFIRALPPSLTCHEQQHIGLQFAPRVQHDIERFERTHMTEKERDVLRSHVQHRARFIA